MSVFTYNSDTFLLDGKEFTILSGALHYFRFLPEQWEDRLVKMKAMGLNTVETYTCWNLHERKEGKFDFEGRLDIVRFIQTADKLGMKVILRPGPYICAEWEFGGLPSWLLNIQGIRLRSRDSIYLEKVKNYYTELFRRVTPLLCTNGGPVIMVQVENEYGSYGNDKVYLAAVRDICRSVGVDCMLFTSDGDMDVMLTGGRCDECLTTVNFGVDGTYERAFSKLKALQPTSPIMCAEYWAGTFCHWRDEHHKTISISDGCDQFGKMLDMGASVNIYMFCGGTNFGFTNGANYEAEGYLPDVTSYDYDALLTEAGDITPKYLAYQNEIRKRFGVPDIEVHNSSKMAYGEVKLTHFAPLFDSVPRLSEAVESAEPLTMEELGQDFGYVLYSATVKGPIEKMPFTLGKVHDRAIVFFDGVYQGTVERSRINDSITLEIGENESVKIDILLENMGRINYCAHLPDRKGLLYGVTLQEKFKLHGWKNYPLGMENLDKLCFAPCDKPLESHAPCFYKGTFNTDKCCDTFIRLDGFTKGFVTVNGFNIGRYYNPAGPQKTLYIPAQLLKNGENEIIVFESDMTHSLTVTLTDTPDIGL